MKKRTFPADFVVLTFYFETFNVVHIIQHVKGISEWLADVGGSLGLYLGASIFTVVEMLALGLLGCGIALKTLARHTRGLTAHGPQLE